jgi:AcrR family transcriptional regulator
MIHRMPERDSDVPARHRSGRERILDAAYELFSRSGVRAIGVDTITAEADVAKMTLYRNFASKNDLALAFLALREQRWTVGWVQDEVLRRASNPSAQLLTIFEIFGEWFAREDLEGCAFVTSLLEFDDRTDPVRAACVTHLANIRSFVCDLATAAGVVDAERFASQWHILMKGSIVAAHEGDIEAASKARELGELLLERHGVALPV